MIGGNDNHNFQNSNYYIFMKDKKSFFYWINRTLFNLKTYKLFNLLIRSFSRKNVNFIKVENYPEDIKNKIRLVREYYFHIERNFVKSKEILNEILQTDKNNYDAYLMLGWIALDSDEFALAEKNLKRAKEVNPYRSEAYEQLFRLYCGLGDRKSADNELKEMLNLFSEREDLKKLKIFGIPLHQDIALWSKELKYNLCKIVEYLKSNKINIILMNYPKPRPLHTEIINEIANKYKLIYIDNCIYLDKNKDKSNFSSDSHPNELGYSIIAKNVFNVLKEINNK
jgi:tetratricopeptide (TPR) repeat protein